MSRRATPTTAAEPVLQLIRSLSHRSARDRSGLFWIEGIRNFVEACHAGLRFESVVRSPILLKSSLVGMLARQLAAQGVPQWQVSPEQFRSVCRAEHASGIGAVARQHWIPLERAASKPGLCWVVVEHLRSPGNLGSIIRTAEAVSAAGLLFVGPTCDPFDCGVVRASMSGILRLPLARATPDKLRAWVEATGTTLVGLSPEGSRLWTDLPTSPRIGLVLGDERRGLSVALRSLCHSFVRLPMTGRADSLNVGVAAGIVMYELVRRRTNGEKT